MKKIFILLVVFAGLVVFSKAVSTTPLSSQVDLGSHVSIDDNNEIILGNDSDFSINFDSTATELQIRIGSDNVSPEDSSDSITIDTNNLVTIKEDITVTDDINVGNTGAVIDYDSTNANIDISTSVVVTGALTSSDLTVSDDLTVTDDLIIGNAAAIIDYDSTNKNIDISTGVVITGALTATDLTITNDAAITGDVTAANLNGTFDGTLELTYTAFTSSDAAVTTSQFGFIDVQYATCTINLPAVSGTAGKSYIIKHSTTSTGVVTIDGNGSETIDGSETNTDLDTANDCLTIFSTGSAWKIIQRYIQ